MTKSKWNIGYLAIWWVSFFLPSCKESDADTSLYRFEAPAHFPDATYTFDNNPVTKAGFELGKKLFFDPILSADKSVSCNNCHQQARAFADLPLHATSIGIDNLPGTRNAPPIMNVAFMPEFFWDGGVTHVDFVPINAIESDVEMGNELATVVASLNADEAYVQLFKDAFDIEAITSPYMLYALSQFLNMMISADSPYDQYILGTGETLSTMELEGLAVFEQKCGYCHSGELFTDFSYRNNGLDSAFTDLGRGAITESATDNGKFRVPSLRNAAITGPYMHNAQFSSLEEVLDHYDSGMVYSSTLDPSFLDGDVVVGIPLTEDEKTNIIAFIHTLTDETFTSNPLFQNND